MKIYVGNLAYSVTDDQLQTAFGAFGEVTSATVISDKFSGQSKGFGFVEMPDNGAAQKAIQSLNGTQFEGRSLTVNEAKPMARRDDGGGRGNRQGGRNRWKTIRFLASRLGQQVGLPLFNCPACHRRRNSIAGISTWFAGQARTS